LIRKAPEKNIEIRHKLKLIPIGLKQLTVFEGLFARLDVRVNPDKIARHDG
jgi:hypothetical protein